MTETLSAHSSFSDYVKEEEPEFLEALRNTVFPEEVQPAPSPSTPRPNSNNDVHLPRKRFKPDEKSQPPAPLYTSDPVTFADASRVTDYDPFISNKHAQRLMADPAFRAGHTSAAGGDFIDGFYKNSRLHHLSTWKEELKLLVAQAQEKAEKAFATGHTVDETTNGSETLGMVGKVSSESSTSVRGNALNMLGSTNSNKAKHKPEEIDLDTVIMHCDFDCFFASVGLLTRSYLKDKPVVVCHSQGTQGGDKSTSEVSSANYKAREFGIRNGIRCVRPYLSPKTVSSLHSVSLQSARKLCPSLVTIPYEFERCVT